MLDQLEIRETLEIQDLEDSLVHQEPQVRQGAKDQLGVLGIVGTQDHVVSQELMVYREHKDLQEDQVNKDHKVLRAGQDPMVLRVLLGLVVAQVL